MEPKDVIKLEGLQEQLKNLVNKFVARSPDEWEIKERLTSANKVLRQIDTSKLRQFRMEID